MKILKGVVYFDRYDFTNTEYMGERDLGNAPAFAFNIALEKLEHFSSRGGLKAKDKEVISQITPGVTFTLDEVNKDNLAMLALGETLTVTQAGATISGEVHEAHPGRRIVLTDRDASSVIVTGPSGTPTYDHGVGNDYLIDTELRDDVIGRILILEGGSITEGELLEVDYTSAATEWIEIRAFNETIVEGRLRFVSDNPVGTQQELEVWRCSLTPTGDTAMIGDDWSTLGFTGEILKDSTGHPDSPYMTITIV